MFPLIYSDLHCTSLNVRFYSCYRCYTCDYRMRVSFCPPKVKSSEGLSLFSGIWPHHTNTTSMHLLNSQKILHGLEYVSPFVWIIPTEGQGTILLFRTSFGQLVSVSCSNQNPYFPTHDPPQLLPVDQYSVYKHTLRRRVSLFHGPDLYLHSLNLTKVPHWLP